MSEYRQSRRQARQHACGRWQQQPESARAAENPQYEGYGQGYAGKTHYPAFFFCIGFGGCCKKCAAPGQDFGVPVGCQCLCFLEQMTQGILRKGIVGQLCTYPNPGFSVVFVEQHTVFGMPLQTGLGIDLPATKRPKPSQSSSKGRGGYGKRVSGIFGALAEIVGGFFRSANAVELRVGRLN